MQLAILKSSTLSLLRTAVTQASRLDEYRSAAHCGFVDSSELLPTAVLVPDEPPELVEPPADATERARSATDVGNATLVHQYLRSLSRTQAADERLWTTLSHTVFWTYTRARWPVGADDEKAQTAVLRHWFVPRGGSKSALRTQAISRLWWAGHLTWAPWEQSAELEVFRDADPYKYTRILLRNQQFYFDTIERNYGSSLRLRTCLLDALDRHLPSVTRKDALSKATAKRLNLMLGHRQLGGMPLDDLRTACDRLVAGIAASL